MTPPMVVMVAVWSGVDESSCVLVRMKVVVFESCLQKSKDVIFEGISDEGLVMVSWRMKKKKMKMMKKVERSWRLRDLEREWEVENKNECVCVCVCYVVALGFKVFGGRYFVSFCVN